MNGGAEVSQIVVYLKDDLNFTFEVSDKNVTLSEVLDIFNTALAPRHFAIKGLRRSKALKSH
jgi:hypothetical protein